MKKYIMLFSILCLGLFNHASFSQDLNILKNASYIFKGRVVQYTPFKNENDIWMLAYSIEIKSIYKGDDLKLDTITLIAESVNGWNQSGDYFIPNISSDYTPEEKNKFSFGMGPGNICVFFCNQYKGSLKYLPNEVQIWNRIIQINNKSIILEPICKTRNCYFGIFPDLYYYKDENNKVIGPIKVRGCGKDFKSEEEFMEYLKNENIISSSQIIKKKM